MTTYPKGPPPTSLSSAELSFLLEMADLIPGPIGIFFEGLGKGIAVGQALSDKETTTLRQVRVLSRRLWEVTGQLWHETGHAKMFARLPKAHRLYALRATELKDTAVKAKVLAGQLRVAIAHYERAVAATARNRQDSAKSIRRSVEAYALEADKRAAKAYVRGASPQR